MRDPAFSAKADEFTESDWMAFAGATAWTEFVGGHPMRRDPLIREFSECTVIVGAQAVEIFPDGVESPFAVMHIAFPTQQVARCFLDGMPSDFHSSQAKEYGFFLI